MKLSIYVMILRGDVMTNQMMAATFNCSGADVEIHTLTKPDDVESLFEK